MEVALAEPEVRPERRECQDGSMPVEKVYREIADKIAVARTRKGREMSARELSLKLGAAHGYIAAIENYRRRVRLHDLPQIADVLGIEVRELLPREWR